MKRLLIIIPVLFLLLASGLVYALYYAGRQIEHHLNRSMVVEQIESNLNVRAELDSIDYDFFSSLFYIELKGLRIGNSDRYSKEGIPLLERPGMRDYFAALESIRLSISPFEILEGKIHINEFSFNGIQLRVNIYPGGVTNLDRALDPPERSGDPRKGDDEKEKVRAPAPSNRRPRQPALSTAEIWKLLPAGVVENTGIHNARFEITIVRSGYKILLQVNRAKIKELLVDPAKLDTINSVDLAADGTLRVLSRFNNENLTVRFAMDDRITPLLNPRTGKPNLKPELTALVLKGSRIQDFIATDYLIRKIDTLRELGLVGQKMTGPVTAMKDTPVRLQFSLDGIRILNNPFLETDVFNLQLKKGSWIRLSDEEHRFDGSLLLLDEDTKTVLDAVDVLLRPVKEVAPESAARIRTELLRDAVENERVRIRFRSTGNIEEPEVVILSPLPSTERLKDAINQDPEIRSAKETFHAITDKVEDLAQEQGEKIGETLDKLGEEHGKDVMDAVEKLPGQETGKAVREEAEKFLDNLPDTLFGSSDPEEDVAEPEKTE